MSTRLRTHIVIYERDFYHLLRPLIKPLRELLQELPPPPGVAGSTLPVLHPSANKIMCQELSNAELLRRLKPFHEAIVSCSYCL